MRRLLYPLIFLIFLSSCAAPTPIPTPTEKLTATSTHTPRPTNTLTETPTVTPSPTPEPVEIPIQLFFDMNGSGLRDEATFVYEKDFFDPEKFQGRPELFNAVQAMDEVPDGQLLTIPEPALYDGLEVCLGVECVTPDEHGRVTFTRAVDKIGSTARIEIKDLNADVPWLALRYMNIYKGPVVVSEYTVDVDPAVMNTVAVILGCDSTEDLVCKLDEYTLLVRDQHLNDTYIQSIEEPVKFPTGQDEVNELGLMQGFLTLPFFAEQVPEPFILNYFDILGVRLFTDSFQYYDSLDGVSLTYNGEYHQEGVLSTTSLIPGIWDNHTGIDYVKINRGDLIISGAPTSILFYTTIQPRETEIRVHTYFDNPTSHSKNASGYGHLDVRLVEINQVIYRGQILGLAGSSNMHPPIPTLHYDFEELIPEGWKYLDMYRYTTTEVDPLSNDFWGNPVSMWTSDNNPIFSLSDIPNQ